MNVCLWLVSNSQPLGEKTNVRKVRDFLILAINKKREDKSSQKFAYVLNGIKFFDIVIV